MDNLSTVEEPVTLKVLILKIMDWWDYLLSRWIIVIAAGIIGGMIGLVYAFQKDASYTAELTFVLEDDQASGSNMGGYASIAGQFGLDVGGAGGGVFAGENLLALMKSRAMVEKALMTAVEFKGKKKTLAEFFIDIKQLKVKEGIKFLPGAVPSSFSLDQNRLMHSFHGTIINKHLSLDRLDSKSKIIVVTVISENELFSKYFVEALVKVVTDFYVETKVKKSAENLYILQRQTDSVKRAYNSAIGGVAASVDANPNPNPARQVLRVPSQRRQFDVRANEVMLTQLIQNLESAKISLRKETPLIQVIDRPILPLPEETYSKFNGLFFGGILGLFVAVFMLIITKVIKDVMA